MNKNLYIAMMALGFLLGASEGGTMIQFLIVKAIAFVLMVYGYKKYAGAEHDYL